MATQHSSAAGYGHTPEEFNAIVRRAHLERAQAMREFFARPFARRSTTADATEQPARTDAMACG